MPDLYNFRLLRYAPNRLSDEFYNIAVFLYENGGPLVDARFAPDFLRLRSNPLADISFLQALRDEFENRRLAGEGFSEYVEELGKNLSLALQLSQERFFVGDSPLEEMERLARTYLATRRPPGARQVEESSGSRRWVLHRMQEAFRAHELIDRLQAEVPVGTYVSPRFSFHIDYAYRPNGATHYIQALSARRDIADAGRLCFVFDRMNLQAASEMTAVVADDLPDDTHILLESSRIRRCPVSELHELASSIRQELGLH